MMRPPSPTLSCGLQGNCGPHWATSTQAFLHRMLAVLIATACLGCGDARAGEPQEEQGRTGEAARRAPWTQSRIVGSPEPPLPLVLERVHPQLEFDKPVSIHPLPGSQRLVVCEQGGKIYSFDRTTDPAAADLMADFNAERPPLSEIAAEASTRIELYSLAFHPDFARNRRVVVCYVVQGGGARFADGSHIASFQLSRSEPPRLLMDTEQTVLRFDAGGHNGCCVAFDNDGLLYISTGDVASPTPPDPYNHGQNVGDVYSAILRIDMDRPSDGRGYSIPADNPFVDLPGARPEIYAYGFRNPWRMSFDRVSGDLWVGDVGWEAWEMIYRVRLGGNYGWPIKEGPGDARPDAVGGPTPILPADVALSHAEAASVTGGVVYHGEKLPEIQGQYVFGDWVTRKFWSVAFDEQQVLAVREIAFGPVKPISFELDHDGELLILDYNSAGTSGIYRFVPNPKPPSTEPFPTRLSETGLASSMSPFRPAPGVMPYQIQAPMWRDGAEAEYWLAIPGTDRATFFQQPQTMFDWFRTQVVFPPGSVLVKTYWLQSVADDPASRRPIETQLAHNLALGDWNYYSYRWNEEATDAELVPASGAVATIPITDRSAAGQHTELNWSFAARSQCRTCHTPWRGETLGLIELQLRRPHAGSDSWRELLHGGYIAADSNPSPQADDRFGALVNPHDGNHTLEQRARSYLHANCAHCHLHGGNSSAAIDVSFEKPLQQTGLIDTRAMRGDMQLDDAHLVAAGAPERSVLLYRMAKLGSGRMPPLASEHVDHAGVDLIARWIAELNADSLPNAVASQNRQWLRQLLADPTAGASAEPTSAAHAAQQRDAAARLLQSASGGLLLATAIAGNQIDRQRLPKLIDQALQAPPQIAELFESWADPSQRSQRLGPGFDPQQVLALVGDADRGRDLFLSGRGQCSQCHAIHGRGIGLGPDLSKVGSKYTQDLELLRQIIEPSAEVAQEERALTLLTVSGQTLTGRVLQRSETVLQLQDAAGRTHTIDHDQIELEKPAEKSLMPEQLLDALTAQQAADLLAYLRELK